MTVFDNNWEFNANFRTHTVFFIRQENEGEGEGEERPGLGGRRGVGGEEEGGNKQQSNFQSNEWIIE